MPEFPTIFYWVAATRLDGIGPIRIRRWLDYFGDIKNLFSATDAELKSAGLTPQNRDAFKNINWQKIERDIVWCEKNNCHLIAQTHPHYPSLLRETADSPVLLYVRGETQLLTQSQLAIVGSRNPTVPGCETAERFARCLAKAGLIVTSGLALGIDAASHRGALAAGGKTIAVIGTGLQRVYPASHRKLAEEIITNGALVSEFPPDMGAKAQNFPLRNRVISGMSLGVLVVEAAVQSGSLITARFALEQNREVFAIPGSIHNPLSRGCHQLIRQGAKLVETAEDILEEIGALHAVVVEESQEIPLSKEYKQMLKCIGYETTALDTIVARCRLPASDVSSLLLMLELEGCIVSRSGGYMRIR